MSLPSPNIPTFPTCPSFLDSRVGIVLYYKDKTAFITGATVRVKTFLDIYLGTAVSTGVLYHSCFTKAVGIKLTAQKNGIDFGNGIGKEATVGSVSGVERGLGDYMFQAFVSNTPFQCPLTPPLNILTTNFDSVITTAVPNVTVLPITGYVADVGSISITEGSFKIFLDEIEIYSGKVPSNGKIDVNLPSLKDISSLIGKTSVVVKVVISWYHCKFTNSKTVSLPLPTSITPPCTGSFVPPNMSSLLAGITTPPSSLFVPVGLTGGKTSVPVEIYVGGTRVATQPTGFTGFDLIKTIKGYYGSAAPRFDLQHNITIKSTATDCKIPDLVIPIKPLAEITICTPPQIPNSITGKCETPSIPGCDQFITTVTEGYPSHNNEITNLLAPFYVYIRGVKEVCKSDPTNPLFSSPLPKGTMGTITLGNLLSNFYLTSDGVADLDLVRDLGFDLSSLTEAAPGVTPQPVAVLQPSTPSAPGERVGSYCTLKPFILSGQTFYDVIHDTAGKIYSGNTYDQAKYKAQKDARCFPTPTVAPCVTITITHSKWNDPRNAVIGFYSTKVGSRFAEGTQSWGWGGNPKPTDAEYLQTVAIPRTLEYLGGKFKSLYGRDMLKTDICGQR